MERLLDTVYDTPEQDEDLSCIAHLPEVPVTDEQESDRVHVVRPKGRKKL